MKFRLCARGGGQRAGTLNQRPWVQILGGALIFQQVTPLGPEQYTSISLLHV
jgi:hypothetical protein